MGFSALRADRLGTPYGPDLRDASRLIGTATAVLSIAAGIIHVSAAADHEHLPLMMVGFLIVAVLQVALGGLLIWRRPTPLLILAGWALMVSSLALWLLSRTVGLEFLDIAHTEPIGFKDGVTVLFELGTLPGLLLLLSPDVAKVSLPSSRLGTNSLALLSAGAFALFVPALTLGGGNHHTHEQLAEMEGYGHGEDAEGEDGHAHGTTVADAEAGEPHGDEPVPGGAHEHGSGGDGHAAGGHGHGAGGPGAGAGAAAMDGHGGAGHAHGDPQALVTQETISSPSGHPHGSAGHTQSSTTGGAGGMGHEHGGASAGHGHGGGGGHEHGGDGNAGDGGRHGDHTGGHGADGGHAGGHTDGNGADGHSGDHGAGGHTGGGHPMPADDLSDPPWPGVITERLASILPKPAGTRETIRLQYGPLTIPPGGDATAIRVDVSMVEGFAVASQPRLRFADGATADHSEGVHLHHAHLFRLAHDQDAVGNTCPGCEWVFGTGDEQTNGSFEKIAAADGPDGPQYGTQFYRGDGMLFISMPMNMTTEPKTVYTEFAFEFIHGSPEEIKAATGLEYRPITGMLHGTTFNVPKTGGYYRWPMDAPPFTETGLAATDADPESFMSAQPSGSGAIRRGVGHIWTAPSDGMIMGAAGHAHGGATGIVFSNLGSEERPCGDTDGDGIPGTRIFRSKAYYPPGIFPAHLKMGVTQPGWRAYVEEGDRIATNGVYDSRFYAWPDQMSVVGMYWDHNVDVDPAQRCKPVLVDEPDATLDEITESLPDQDSERGDDGAHLFHSHGPEPCIGDECNDYDAPPLRPGEHTNTITISDFRFSSGDMSVNGLGGGKPAMDGTAPVVTRGERLRFVNLDYFRYAGTRHAPTSCHGPCNGPDAMSYPLSDGLFYSGPMGYVLLAEYASNDNQLLPIWDLDTSNLDEGYHTYYCWQHPWMRGAFYVDDPAS